MADVASLAVGLYLNNAFTPQLTAVYRQASDQSRRFSRDVQQDTKKPKWPTSTWRPLLAASPRDWPGWRGWGCPWARLFTPRGNTARRCRICRR
ncbi:hypothetical protein SODG_006377 [Sodalis praecaptivus]